MKSAHFYQYCCIFTFSWVGFLALSRVFLTACSVALILLHHSLLLFHPLLVCKSVHVWRCLSLCVCTCGRVYVTVAVLVNLLATSLFSVLCHNYYDDYQSYLNVCVCGGGDLHLHTKHCLCRVSLLRHAVSIAAARANTANHAHFLVSSYWYWLILTPIQIVFLFFLFCAACYLDVWAGLDTLRHPLYIHSSRGDQCVRNKDKT